MSTREEGGVYGVLAGNGKPENEDDEAPLKVKGNADGGMDGYKSDSMKHSLKHGGGGSTLKTGRLLKDISKKR